MLRYLFLLGFFIIPLLTMSQEREDRSTLLPDIDPQDIEIRGDFRARFPGLSRQPILGFNPKPRVFQMDPDRMPYIESEEDAVAGISPSDLEQPYSPARERIRYPDQSRLFGRLGFGNHESPEARFFGEAAVSDHSVVTGDVNYLSSESYVAEELTSFRYLSGRSDWIRRKNNSRLQIGLTGRSDFNYAIPGINDPGNSVNHRKEYSKIGTHASFRHLKNAYNGWDLNAGYHYFQVDDNTPLEYSAEHFGRFGAARFWDGQRMEEVFSIELHGEGSLYNTFEEEDLSWYTARLSAFYKRKLINSNISAGLDVYNAYDEVEDPIRLFIFPNIRFHYTGLKSGEAEITIKSFVQNSGLEGVHLENRQLLIDPVIHNEHGFRVSANAHYDVFRGGRIFGNMKFNGYGSYAYYLLETGGYSLNFDDDTNIFEATLGFSYDFIPRLLTLHSDLTLRNSSMSDNQSVPFLENFKSTASLYSNPVGKLYLRAWTEYRGSRPVNFDEENMDSYFLFGAQVDYKITENFGAYIKGLNLLNQDYEIWRGYQERPAQVYGGLTLHF